MNKTIEEIVNKISEFMLVKQYPRKWTVEMEEQYKKIEDAVLHDRFGKISASTIKAGVIDGLSQTKGGKQ